LDKAEALVKQGLEYLKPGNFYDFCKDVMDRDFEPQPHEEMCSVAEHAMSSFEDYYVRGVTPGPDDKIYYMCLTPRDSFKSTVWSECMPVNLILKHPNIRILIDSENSGKAEKFASAGKEHFEANPKLRAYYGDLVPQNKNDAVWSRGQYRTTSRTRVGLREHTMMTCGIGTTMPGMHYDVIICDDLVSEKNVTTPEQVEKVTNHIREMQSLLSPGGLLFIIGTRWHYDDAYASILGDPDQRSLYNIFIRSAGGTLDPDEITGKPKPLFFPGRLTEAFLQKKLKSQKRYIFSCQYLNRPVPAGEQAFDTSRYGFISKQEFLSTIIKSGNFRWYYLVDPAITEDKKKRGDYTALSSYVVTPDGRKYLYRAKAGKWGEDSVIDEIYNHYISVRADLGPSYNNAAHVEAVAFQKLLLSSLKRMTEKHGQKIKWKELKQENRTSKEVRIRSAIPHLEDGDLWIVEDNPSPSQHNCTGANQLLIEQASRFPYCKNDDLLDNQGFILELAKPPRPPSDPEERLCWDARMGVTPKETRPQDVKQELESFDELDEASEFAESVAEKWYN
jgi:hypothetical protein